MNINVTPSFVLAGSATFTVSNQSGSHYTYNVYSTEPSQQFPERAWFITVLTSPEHYEYAGKIVLRNLDPRQPGDPYIRFTAKSKFKPTDKSMKVANWALRTIWQVARDNYRLPAGYSIKHNGHCGRCGRELTNPASLDTGLGPECAAQSGVEWAERTDRQPALPIRMCERCGKVPADPAIEVCRECAQYNQDYATGDDHHAGELGPAHPGHPSNFGYK